MFAWLLIVGPIIAVPWAILAYFGPGWAVLSIAGGFVLWYAIAGIPAPASGSKAASCGWVCILASSVLLILVCLISLCLRFLGYHE